MGQNIFQTTGVSSQFLFQTFRACQELGARKPVLLSALNLTERQLRDPQAIFDSEAITVLCQATAQELGRENIYRDIGYGIVPSGFSDIGYGAMFGDTVGDVLKAAATAMDFGINRPMFRWEQSESACRLLWDSASPVSQHLLSIIFATLSHIGTAVTGEDLTPVKAVYFARRQHWDGDDPETAENHWPQETWFFNQTETYLDLHRHVVDLPNPFRNPVVVGAMEDQLNRFQFAEGGRSSLVNRCYYYLLPLLDKSGLGIDATAETFGMAERTLRRKFVSEGTSFRRILEQVRRDTCQLYFLEGSRSLSEIATKLGYSELSALTRAYTAWYGRAPSRDMAAHIALAA
ncbi:MAG: helix-turn-helix domain-containing protein [Parasphingorhabdus sp.]|uniref:helix-turn-helix domain-containing protein n=1 Tax=Parasphingorhabdus sp. TaxID=2709688 RepID=UPI003002E6E9